MSLLGEGQDSGEGGDKKKMAMRGGGGDVEISDTLYS